MPRPYGWRIPFSACLYTALRTKPIPRFYQVNPSLMKFIILLNTMNSKLINIVLLARLCIEYLFSSCMSLWNTINSIYKSHMRLYRLNGIIAENNCIYECDSHEIGWIPRECIPPGTKWWRHQLEKISALLALCAGNSSVTGEFPLQRPVTRSFDVFFDLRLNKRMSDQSRRR